MTTPLTVEFSFQRSRAGRGAATRMTVGAPDPSQPSGRTPRISRLMALAIRFDQLIRDAEVANYAEIACLGQVTRARITQIMNLLMLAPDIQEEILFLPRVERGHDTIILRQLQSIALVPDWRKQRRLWRTVASA